MDVRCYTINVLRKLKQILRKLRVRQEAAAEDLAVMLEKFDGELTDNMRALRLVASIADQLLSRGMASSDVVHLALGITNTYCTRKVHIDVSYTILTLSQDRGIDREPLTLVRTVSSRGADYRVIERLQQLADDIRRGVVPMNDAERRLDAILTKQRTYPRWVMHLSSGGVSAGVAILYTASPVMLALVFVMGVLVSMLLYRLAKLGMPSFFSQALAACVITLIAAAVSWLGTQGMVPFLMHVNPTLIVIGGIVLLVAGMMIVGAFQDAIDEYYVTATARLLKVAMMTGGIVLGTAIGLYIADRFGIVLSTTPDRLTLTGTSYQYIGAVVMSASFALGNQARWSGVLFAGMVGFLSLVVYLFMVEAGFGVVAASGAAAVVVGVAATVLLRLAGVPSIATINSGILPLVPGLTLYNGLMHTVQSVPSTSEFDSGVAILLRALMIALAVAAGATLGNLIGRPARRRLIHFQNRLPFHRLSAHRKNT